MRVNSTVKLNMAQIRAVTQAAQTALEKTAEELHTEIVQARVVPRMDGTLQNEKFFVDLSRSGKGTVCLVHEGPYARRLYYHPEYHFQKGPWEETVVHRDGSVSHLTHEGNPEAKGKWFEDWEPGGRKADFVPDIFRRIFRRAGGR